MAKKKKHKARSIIAGHLEKVGSKVFDDYRTVITELIKGNQGIYALFKKDRLYYVGLARNLKSRINAHTKDGHQHKWTHFSLYIIRKEDHIKEIESLVLRIAYPKGNKVKGKLKQSKDLRPLLKSKLKEEWERQLNGIIGGRLKPAERTSKRKTEKSCERPMKGLLKNWQRIYCTYKDKDYKAMVRPNGVIEVFPSREQFDSPSMAGLKIIKKKTINGWRFWKYKNKNGELVYIDELRNKKCK